MILDRYDWWVGAARERVEWSCATKGSGVVWGKNLTGTSRRLL